MEKAFSKSSDMYPANNNLFPKLRKGAELEAQILFPLTGKIQ